MTTRRRSIRLVAAREIAERAGSRAFLVSTLVMVAIVVATVVVPGLRDTRADLRAGLTGATPPALVSGLRAAARADGAELRLERYPTVASGEAAVRDRRVGVLVIDGRSLVWKADPDARLAAIVTAALQRARWSERAAELGVAPAQAAALLQPVSVPGRVLEPPDGARESREAIAMIGFVLLLLVVVFYGNAVAEGVAQEKGGRVMEVLLCRVRADDLLAGKIVGIGLVGLAQILVAALAGAAAALAVDEVDVPAAVPFTLAMAVLWFVLGYAFWSVLFAAAGAMVSRVEDLASVTLPLTSVLMLSALAGAVVQEAPDAWYIRLASVVPLTAPFVMPVRSALGHPAAWEIALGAGVMLAATYGLVRVAARLSTGVLLRTGGRPRPADAWRALRSH